MYVPPAFAADDQQALSMIEATAFGALVVGGAEGLTAAQTPFIVERDPLRLIGHVARGNPIWRTSTQAAMMIVQGPNAYVSPGFYPSKAEHGRVAPTWNYQAAHMQGDVEWFEDRSRLLDVVERLTACFEKDQPRPWAVADAPADYTEKLLTAIVGFELRVTRLEAAHKLSQNKSAADRGGVIAGLAAGAKSDLAVAEAMQS